MNYKKPGIKLIEDLYQGLSTEEAERKKEIYGKCFLNVPMPNVWEILISEILHPLYVFQILSVVVWCLFEYYYYCGIIAIMLIFSIFSELLLARQHLKETRQMAHYKCEIKVHRKEQVITICSEDLVPGDVFEAPLKKRMPCDAVIIHGSCMVDESMLTGESMPIMKNEITADNSIYHPETSGVCTLYEGTEVTDL